MLPEFVRLAMNSPRGRVAIESFCATTAGNIGISASDLKTVLVPVPSLEEQRATVRHWDETQSRLLQIASIAKEASDELNALLPAILDRAFRGEL